jgi:hypothetical protein
VVAILWLIANRAKPIKEAVPPSDLQTGGKTATNQLPKEDFDLRRNPGPPNFLEAGDSCPVRKMEID